MDPGRRRTSPPQAVALAIERTRQLDRAGDALTGAIRTALPAGRIKDLLSGTPLGHSLHPMLTDVPIGAWTSSVVLDWVGGRKARPAADKLILFGILAAVPASLTGASDWGDTQAKERRVGLVHAAANTAALGLYCGSLLARRRGRRMRGRALSLAGAGAVGVGGYLGGHLVFARGLGVDRTAFETRPHDWADVAAAADVIEGTPLGAHVDGVGVVIVRDEGELHVLADRCTHRGAPLHEGDQRDGCIVCPWHQSIFRLRDGAVIQGPATTPAPCYEIRVRDGRVEVRVPPQEID
jgi:nitrite reductase/ring-hydroxylating ferredoxin subunit